MAVDFDSFRLMFPELVSCGNENKSGIEQCILEAEMILGTPPCPKMADSLVSTLAAHCVAKSGYNPGGIDEAPGIANSISVGSVSISYQVTETQSAGGTLKSYYNSTQYGRKFLVFSKYCFGTGIMVAP